MTALVLGVDGGGTRTRAAIADRGGRVLGSGEAGGSNLDDVGPDALRVRLAAAVAAARQAAGQPSAPFAAACLGLAGVVSGADVAAVGAAVAPLDLAPAGRLLIDHDARVALAGGLDLAPGLVLIAGTGSACFAMNGAGARHLAGGWGHLLADEGGGYWLGLEALRAAARADDGRGPPTALTAEVRAALSLSALSGLMHRLYVQGLSRAEIAALAPRVLGAARAGDPVAADLVERGAQALARAAQAAAARVQLRAPDLVLAGGVFGAGEVVLGPLRRALSDALPGARVLPAHRPPVEGACLLARALLEAAGAA